MLKESLALLEEAGDVRGVAYAYFALTGVSARLRGVEGALPYAEAAAAHARVAADDGLLGPALGNLGLCYVAGGDLDAGRTTLAEAREAARRAGDIAAEVGALLSLANGAAFEGDLDEALALSEEAVELGRPSEASLHLAQAMAMLAALRLLTGDLPAARESLGQAGQLAANVDSYEFLYTVGTIAAALATAEGAPEAAPLWEATMTLQTDRWEHVSEWVHVRTLVVERFGADTTYDPIDASTATQRVLAAVTPRPREAGNLA